MFKYHNKISKWAHKIIQICNKEKPNVILPSIEEEIIKLSKNRKIFEEKNILILSPEFNISKICADKLQTREKFLAHKIPTYGIFSNNTHFPCIIKPQFGRGGKDVFKVNNSESNNNSTANECISSRATILK